jgi:hypothetical protein
VMAEVRKSRPAGQDPNQPRPGESQEAFLERKTRGWLFMRKLMSDTRAREDGTWYRDEKDPETGTP